MDSPGPRRPSNLATIAQMDVRLAELADAEAIRAIYNAEVLSSTSTFDQVPRTAPEQLVWMHEHASTHPAIVARDATGVIVGFGSLSPFRDRPSYATTVENSVYVIEGQRGLGVGRALMDELVRLSTLHGFHTMVARIGGNNEGSIALHQACGFDIVGIEREVGRKFNRWLDVMVMQRML